LCLSLKEPSKMAEDNSSGRKPGDQFRARPEPAIAGDRRIEAVADFYRPVGARSFGSFIHGLTPVATNYRPLSRAGRTPICYCVVAPISSPAIAGWLNLGMLQDSLMFD
jgi:hypothetical protein